MSFSEWTKQQKKKEEEEKKSSSSSSADSTKGGKKSFSEWTKQQQANTVDGWLTSSENIIRSVQRNTQKWHDEKAYKSSFDEISSLLAQADGWRKQFAGNREAISVIDSVVSALSDAKNYAFKSRKYFSQFKDEDDYNFVVTHSTPEKRQAWYQDQQKQIDELSNFYDTYHSTDLMYREYRANPAAFTQEEANDIIANYEKHDAFKKKYGINTLYDVEDKISAIEAEMRNYERGNYNENGRFYGSKVDDDHYWVTQTPDFAITSAKRDYKNPTREELQAYDNSAMTANTILGQETIIYEDDEGNAYTYGGRLVRGADGSIYDSDGNLVKSAGGPSIQDKLGLYLQATDAEKTATLTQHYGADSNVVNTYGSLIEEGEKGGWKYLEDDELGIYYTYLGESQEKAYRYLNDMKTELNRRQTLDEIGQLDKAYDDANLLEKIALNAATIPAKFVGTVAGTIENTGNILTGNDINPYSKAHEGMHFSQTVRGNTAGELDETGWKVPIIDKVGLDFTLGDIYQTGMSRLDSHLATAVFGGGGTVFLGMGAAQEEAYRLYQQGASAEQVTLGAFAAGASEAVFEYVSFDKLVNMGDADTIFKWVKNALIQGGIEASEETFTDVSNIITNAVIMGQQSDLTKLYEESGGDWFKVGVSLVQQAAQSAFGGFLGGVGAGVTQGGKSYVNAQVQNADTGNTIRSVDGGAKALENLAMDVAGASEGRLSNSIKKQAGKVSGEVATGNGIGKIGAAVKNFSRDVQAGRLYNAVQTANNLANASANQADIAKSLQRKGFNAETANDIASALVARYNGKNLTKAQEKLLKSVEDNKVVSDAISNIMTNELSTMGQRSKDVRSFQGDIARGMVANAIKETIRKNTTAKQFTPTGEYEVSDKGKAINTETGDEIDIKGVSTISRDKMVLKLADGTTIDAKSVSFASNNDALIYEAIASLGDNISAENANKLIAKYDGGKAEVFASGIAQAYTYGFHGIDRSELTGENALASNLTKEQRNYAYGLGEQYRSVKDADDKANAKTIKAPGEKGVFYRDKDGNATDIRSYLKQDGRVLNEMQTTGIEFMEKMSKMMGVRFNVFESWEENGTRYYLDENGKVTEGNPNGFYDPKTGEIYIDLFAGNDFQGTMLFTVAHELTHFMRQWSPEHFTKISKLVFSHAGFKGSVSSLVADKMNGKRKLDYDTALEEVVADGMETILKDGKVAEFMVDVKKTDSKLWAKLKDWFKNFAEFLKKMVAAYSGKSAQTVEGQKVADFSKKLLNQIEQIWAEGAVAAGDAYRAAQEQFSTDTLRGNADGAVVQSEATASIVAKEQPRTEYEAFPKQMMNLSDGAGTILSFIEGLTPTKVNGISGKGINGYTGRDVRGYAMGISGFTKEQISRVNQFMDTMADFMKEAGVTYRFIGLQDVENAQLHYTYNADGSIKSIVLSAMVKNGDYPVNFDLSSICKKRVAMSNLIDKLAKRGSLDNGTVKLTPANIFKINTALKDAGYETACLGCFVESKRYNSLEWAKKFCNKWNAAVKKVNPNATYFGYGDATFSEDSFTLEQAVKIDDAANKYIKSTKTERLQNALEKYRVKEQAGQTLVTSISKAALDRLRKSDTISDELKAKYLNCDPTTLNMADVEFLLENGILPGAALSNKQAVTEMVKSGEAYQHLLRPSDLLTDRGISKLEALPNFHGVLYGHYGSGTPKLMQSYTPYNSEIALLPSKKGDQSLAEYLYTIAGVRMQSFSDFQVQNIYDYLQMVGDLAARKVPAHAYTKEISFAKLLGMTGIKVNLSVMFDIDPMVDKAHAGLTKLNKLVHRGEYAKVVLEDEQGRWVYNIGDYQTQRMFAEAFPDEAKRFLQSIGFADAVKLQTSTGYSANCGIIGVGYSDLGIFAMLDDNRIRYIIPYHASSLPADIKVATHIELGTDYTPYQNNMKIKEIVDRNGNKVNWTIKEAYKRLGSGQAVLNELNEKIRSEGWVVSTTKAQNGHGSYGLYEDLQQTNDPRQTASNFMDWCIGNSTLPLFYQFASHENYYKLLYDFNVYDCVTEEYAPQQAVTNTYPTMVDGEVQPGTVTDGGFDAEYFKGIIDKQMAFMNEYSRNLDEDLNALAENLEKGDYTLYSNRNQKWKPRLDSTEWGIVNSTVKSGEGTAVTNNCNMFFKKSKGSTVFGIYSTDDSTLLYASSDQVAEEEHVFVSLLMEEYRNGKVTDTSTKGLRAWSKAVWMHRTANDYHGVRDVEPGRSAGDAGLYGGTSRLYSSAALRNVLANILQEGTAGRTGDGMVKNSDRDSDKEPFEMDDTAPFPWEHNDAEISEDESIHDYARRGELENYKGDYKPDLAERMFLEIINDEAKTRKQGELSRQNLRKEYDQKLEKLWDSVDQYWFGLFGEYCPYYGSNDSTDIIRTIAREAGHNLVGQGEIQKLTKEIDKVNRDIAALEDDGKNSSATTLYQDRTDDSVSNRALLANAFEGIAKPEELPKIQEYKDKVALINEEEKKLRELNEQIKELSFAKGPRDTKRIKALRFDAVQVANRISTYDKQLLRMEASDPLQKVLNREKKLAYKKAEQRGKEALAEYKAKVEAKQKETAEKWRESRKTAVAKARETADKRDARAKLQKLVLDTVKWISYPAKADVKCPDILKKPYEAFLQGIDLSSKRLANGGEATKNDLRLANAMDSLATAIDRVMLSQDPSQDVDKVLDIGYLDLPADFVQKLRDMTESIKSMMVEGEYVVNTMTAEEVRKLSQMIRTLNHSIKTMSNLYANLRFANVEALGIDTMDFLDAVGEIEKTGGMKDFVQWDNALPFYAFKRFGKGGESVFEGLMDAQDKLAFLAQDIFDFQEKTWTGKEAKAWSEDTHTIKLPHGSELTLTTADAMSIYCLSRREQALPHLLGGGVRVMGVQKGSQKAKDSRSLLTIQDVEAIISSLTDRQKQVAEGIQEFMSTVCSEWGNEISMKRFLTREFTEKFYFPIESNDENLTVKDPAAQQSDLFRLLNISATKPLTQGANNEVIIRNIFDVFTGHASDMARLNAYGMGLLDYMKWLNYRVKTTNNENQIKVRGVRKSMEKAYGKAANSYVLNLIKDVNGRPSDGGDPNILMKWMRSAKTASVGSSIRVATLQITSYPRAALVLSPKSLSLGLTKVPNIKRAKEYCGIALWKSFGFYDTNISRSIEDQMKGVKDVKQKLIELSLKGAEWGDAITWGCLWNACEYEVAKTTKNKVGSEEFYQEVGKKLREVVYRTQVVDSNLTRSQIMRSKRGMAQEAAAFMSEPTLSANILMDAGFEFSLEKRRTGSAKSAWSKTGAYIGRAIAVYSIGQLTAALMEGLWDAWRDEDDEEFWKKYLSAFAENLALDLVPFNKIPIVSDVFEGALSIFGVGFYSSDKMSTTWLTQAVSAVDAWKDVFGGNSSATVYNALYKTLRALSSCYGVSFSGLLREGVALWNNTAGAFDPMLKILTYDRSKAELGDMLLDALIAGDARQADSIRGKFADEDGSQSALRTAIKDRLESGDIDSGTANQYLVNYGGVKVADAYWMVKEWSFNGNAGDDFGKYDSFYTAVETGKDLKAVIKEYTDNGVTAETLKTQITDHFKPLYIEMSNSEKAGIKGYLLNAMTVLGMEREDADEKVQEWEFEGKYGFSYSDRAEAYKSGKISANKLKTILMDVGGKTAEEADLQIEAYDWEKDGYEDVTMAAVREYNEHCAASDVPKDVYLHIRSFANNTENDKDANGKTIYYSAMKKIMAEIDEQYGLTASQKTAIARSLGWAEKNISKYKLW